MSILDQRKLIQSIHPFECLSPEALNALMKKIDIAYYPVDTLLISKNIVSIAFYIIIKGSVNEMQDDEIINVYGPGDSFDADALIYSKTDSKFTVTEDLICYEIKKEDFLELMQDKRVQSYFLQDFVSRHKQLKAHDAQSDFTPFLMAKISDMFLHNACIVESNSSIYDAIALQEEIKAKVIIVKKVDKYFIVTDTNLRQEVLLGGFSVKDSIDKIAKNEIISIDINDFLFNALLIMTKNTIKRIVVTDNGEVVGVLEQLDMLSYFANHSHLVAVKIDKANSIDDLKELQESLRDLITTLRAKGVKFRYISKLVSALNEKIYKKVFDMCVDADLQKHCCLIVMGSEGREEQTLKTDQDNALIIKDLIDKEMFVNPMLQLNKYLLELGFPKCNGNVMVSNDYWRKSVKEFKVQVNEWANSMQENELQNLSIFLDSKCVAGNESLLRDVDDYLYAQFHSRDDVLAHMAKAVLNFETPISMFSGFVTQKELDNKLDLKKGGIFALVHGVRTLSLKHEIKSSNTIERIKELNNIGIIDKNFATELIESFDTMSSIRLIAMLEAKDINESNYINPTQLQKVQRDLLKDSFKIVNKFKKFMNFHFHLNMVG